MISFPVLRLYILWLVMPLEVTSDNYGYFVQNFSTKTTLILTSNSQGFCSGKGHKLTKLENDDEFECLHSIT